MEELIFNASASALAPSGPIPFSVFLGVRNKKIKQNLNTLQIKHFE
jgi:hypothetical protein